jgi:hypothetical protein
MMSKNKSKTVMVSIRFFTDGLKKKAVWDSGSVFLPKQPQHGINNPKSPEMFNGLEEISVKVKTALKRQGIDIVRYNTDRTEKKIL